MSDDNAAGRIGTPRVGEGARLEGRHLPLLIAALLVLCVAFASTPQRAEAACILRSSEAGDWINLDPNTQGIARIQLRDCLPVKTCFFGRCSVKFDVGWSIRVLATCSPTSCDWGWSQSRAPMSGLHLVYGTYDQGYAKRVVTAKLSSSDPNRLQVWWRTDFVDPNRADYQRQEWFKRAPGIVAVP